MANHGHRHESHLYVKSPGIHTYAKIEIALLELNR